MNKFYKVPLAILFVVSTISFNASAQSILGMVKPESWYFMPSANALSPDPAFGVNGHGEGFGLTAGKALSQEWDIQIGAKYAHQYEKGVTYQQNTLGVDGLFLFNRETIRPFLLVGAGYQHDRLSNLSEGYKAAGYAPFVNAGIGVQIAVDNRWTWQLDFRREMGFLRDHDFSTNRNRNNYLNIGLSHTFD